MAHRTSAPHHGSFDPGGRPRAGTPRPVTKGRPASRMRMLSLGLAVVLVLVSLVTGARSAAAHAQLVSSTPADGSVLQSMPESVSFEFNENINPAFAQVVVMGADQRNQAIDGVTVEAAVVSAAMPADLPEGHVVARYRVVSADGHPIAGEISFTVGDGGAATGGPAQSGQQNSAAGAVPNADEAADIAAAPSSQDAPNVAPYALMGLAAVLMVAFGAFILVRERRKP